MTITYYDPRTLVTFEGTLNYITKAGSAFAVLPDNEQAFINSRMVADNQLEVGDRLRLWCADNFSNPETAHHPSRWRTVRMNVLSRVTDIIRDNPNQPIPVSTSSLAVTAGIKKALSRGSPLTLDAMSKEMQQPPAAVLSEISAMHRRGDVACAKIYASGQQSGPSEVYYAKHVDAFYEHLETPIDEE